jgi:hypothetical protein
MPQANTPASKAPWYSIRQHTPAASAARGVQSSAEIFIYGDIGESWFGDSVTAASFVQEVAAIKADALTVRINSYGGSVTDWAGLWIRCRRNRFKFSCVHFSTNFPDFTSSTWSKRITESSDSRKPVNQFSVRYPSPTTSPKRLTTSMVSSAASRISFFVVMCLQ